MRGNDKSRFLVTGPFDEEMPSYYIVISDYDWWNKNEAEVFEWMKQCLPKGKDHLTGMVLTIENENDVSNFILRWGG